MHFSLRTFWKRYTAFFKTMKRGGKTKKETGNTVVESGTPCDPKQTISKSNRCYQEKKSLLSSEMIMSQFISLTKMYY